MSKKTINVKIATSWDDITLAQYEALKGIDTKQDNEGWVVDAVVALSNLTRADVLALPYAEFVKLASRLEFLNGTPRAAKVSDRMTIGGQEFDVSTTIPNIVAGQFLDAKTIVKTPDIPMKIARVCSCFIIPAGKRYGTDYDAEKHVEFLHNNLGVVEALSLADFFTKFSNAYMRSSLRSLRRIMTRARKTTPEQAKTIRQAMEVLQEVESGLSAANGGSASCSNE